jgi:hypothetical protein
LSSQTSNGCFFAYVSIPLIFFAWLSGVTHITIYALGHGWYRNPVESVLGPWEEIEETKAVTSLLNAHALAAIGSVVLITFQVFSALRFRTSPFEEQLQRAHRTVGHGVVITWPIVAASGATYSLYSQHYSSQNTITGEWNPKRGYTLGIFWLPGIGMVVNIVIGYLAVARKAPGGDGMILHKGSMFFALYWVLGNAFAEVLTTIVQLIMHDCGLGKLGLILFSSLAYTVQWVILVASMYHYENGILETRFVLDHAPSVYLWVGVINLRLRP